MHPDEAKEASRDKKMLCGVVFFLLACGVARGQVSVPKTLVSTEVLAMKIPIWDSFPARG